MQATSASSLAIRFHRRNEAPSLIPLEWEEVREEGKMGKKNEYLKL